jgi:predicted transcriptional regulator with HTH domain
MIIQTKNTPIKNISSLIAPSCLERFPLILNRSILSQKILVYPNNIYPTLVDLSKLN